MGSQEGGSFYGNLEQINPYLSINSLWSNCAPYKGKQSGTIRNKSRPWCAAFLSS